MKKFLEGIRVVGFETAGAGPMATRLLAEYGAEVILIEPVDGINTRTSRSFDYYFLDKKSIALNMKTPEGMEILHRLLEKTDIFVSNYRKRVIDKFGLDYETLHQKYPRLIHASLTGYGEKGPMKDAPGFDTTAYWGRAGLASTVRERDGDPIVIPFAMGDISAGTMLCGGILGALYHRERTGEAMRVFISLYNVGIYQNEEQMFFEQLGYHFPQTRKKPRRAHANMYVLKDGCFQFHTLNPNRDVPKVMRIIGREDLIEDPEFKDRWASAPPELAEKIRGILDEGFAGMTVAEAKAAFQREDVAFGELLGPADVLKDPQAHENNCLFLHKCLNGDEVYMAASPVRYMNDELPEYGDAPTCGQHTEEILKAAGYSAEEIRNLEDRRVVNCG